MSIQHMPGFAIQIRVYQDTWNFNTATVDRDHILSWLSWRKCDIKLATICLLLFGFLCFTLVKYVGIQIIITNFTCLNWKTIKGCLWSLNGYQKEY